MTPTPTAPPDHELAERAYRLAAVLFDLGLVAAVWLAASFAGMAASTLLPDLQFMMDLLTNLGALAGCAVLGIVQWGLLTTEGTTLGKRVVGVRVVRDGGPPGFVFGVLVRRLLPRLAVVPTLGLSLLVDALPAFTADRRCVHDRLAGTWVVLDPQAREGDAPLLGRELWVRRGVGFAHVLAVMSLAVAAVFGAIVLQNALTGLADLPGGWVGTTLAAGCALLLAATGAAAYDGRPIAVIGLTIVALGAMLFSGLWFAFLVTFYGAVSPLPWLAAGFSGQLALVAGLFVGPAGRIAVARQELHEQLMLDEMGFGEPVGA